MLTSRSVYVLSPEYQVVLITITYVKIMPPMLKLLALGANVITIYLVIAWVTEKKVKEKHINVIKVEEAQVIEEQEVIKRKAVKEENK